MASSSGRTDCTVSMVSIASGNMDDIRIGDDDDVAYRIFLKSIGGSPAGTRPSASGSVRHRGRSQKRDDGDAAERAETAGTLAAPSAPQDDGGGSPLFDDGEWSTVRLQRMWINSINSIAHIISLVKDDNEATSAADEIITLPESTHSFLFTEPVGSAPFLFGVGIMLLSVTCLLLALVVSSFMRLSRKENEE